MRRAFLASLCVIFFAHCGPAAITDDSAPSSSSRDSNDSSHKSSSDGSSTKPPGGHGVVMELDPVSQAPANVSLLLMTSGFDRDKLVDVVEQELHGIVFQLQGTRLVVAQLPTNADAALAPLGLVTRFTRSVAATEIPSATTEESRFVRVFDSRYYPRQQPAIERIVPLRAVPQPGESFEAPALVHAADTSPVIDYGTTPFASGTIVVSLLLPESNGKIDANQENWTEDLIVQTYQKVQEALEALAKSEPNAHLRFILHYESAPAAGGLAGTIDSDYECALHFQIPQNTGIPSEDDVTAPLLARLLGHAVTSDGVRDASFEYLDGLRARYNADGAYFIKITPDADGKVSFRAHANVNGPSFTAPSESGFYVFMHESGHIFGALDEYCPDACLMTGAQQGYFAINLDNAQNGGEGQRSLMISNDSDFVEGSTRAAWGWMDTDGDGIIEPRDTSPLSTVAATLHGNDLHVTGTIADHAASSVIGRQDVTFNKIVALEYRLADTASTTYYSIPLTPAASVTVDADLGGFPSGAHEVAVRGRNSVGNVEPDRLLTFTVPAGAANSAPRLRVDTNVPVGSTRTTFTITTASADLDAGDTVQTRIDANGDGSYETAWGVGSTTYKFATAGLYHVTAQAKDSHGLTTTATTDVYVVDGNAAPNVGMSNLAFLQAGQLAPAPTLTVAGAVNPDGDALTYNWQLDVESDDGSGHSETGFAAANTRFTPSLPAPQAATITKVDLSAGDSSAFGRGIMQELAISPTLVASAGGQNGVIFSDVTTPTAPVEVAHLRLQGNAEQMVLDGTKLYVLGGAALSVVDLTNAKKPVEVMQPAKSYSRTLTDTTAQAIPDNTMYGAKMVMPSSYSETVTSIEVDVEIDHAAPAQLNLQIELDNGVNGTSVGLPALAAGSPGGDKTYKFTTANAPGLASLIGMNSAGTWAVDVNDLVAGVTGTVKKATILLGTSSTAFPVLANAGSSSSRLLGVLSGHKIVVAGAGLQVIDASKPAALKQSSSLTGTWAYSGGLSGNTAIVLSSFSAPAAQTAALADEPHADATTTPQTHGLYAVDLTTPTRPVVKRQDTSLGDYYGTMSLAGSRAFLNMSGSASGPVGTHVVDVTAFAGNKASYILGSFPVGTQLGDVTGTTSTVWGVALYDAAYHLQSWNVATPATPKLVTDLGTPHGYRVAPLSGTKYLDYETSGGEYTWITDVAALTNTLSKVYRITLQAKDSQGAITQTSRTVHVVPYEHVPVVTAAVTSGSKAGDTFVITPTVTDPDFTQFWDGSLYAEWDVDGDGVYETDWFGGPVMPNAKYLVFPTAGSYVVNLRVRDGLFGVGSTSVNVTVK